MPRSRNYILLCAVALVAPACESDTPTEPSTTTTSPTTVTWSSIVGPGGSLSRSFETTQAGTVTATLASSDAALGVGIGVPRTANGGCRLTVSQVDVAGQAVSVPAGAGSYCVQVFDDGSVVKQASFTVQIVYP